ncbi:MAG: hypothetical protein O7A07_06345 [Acidobacteria bacterium]|nr:hypothetical protein [Acidobacteriota bacterium]
MGKVASRKNAVRLLRAPGFWCLAFVLGAALIVMPLAVGKQKLMLKGVAAAGSAVDNSRTWDAVDAEIDLSGLWGSIDTVHDMDPFIYTEPITDNLHLFWAKWNGDFYEVVRAYRPLGSVWEGPEMVEASPPNSKDNVTPRAILDSMGFLHVAWTRQGGFTSSVYHAVHVSGGWTEPDLLSVPDIIASEPFPWRDDDRTMVDYQTPLELVTVEITITITGHSGGSDDIDPSQVTVDSEEVNRELIPR